MAFLATNVQRTVFGNMNVTRGDWSGTVGDTSGTVTVEGGRIYLANFTSQDTASPTEDNYPTSTSVSGALSTITVYYHNGVTTGRFLIIHA